MTDHDDTAQDGDDELETVTEGVDASAGALDHAAADDASGNVGGDEIDDLEGDDEILVLEEIDTTPTLPVWEPTGDAAVDAALEELATLDDRDRSEHIAVFESVHRRLHDRLSGLSSSS